MGVFDGQTAILFRQSASGQRVYVPFGPWGSVYRVADPDAARITRHVKLFWIGAMVIACTLQIALGWRYTFFLALPLLLACYFGMTWLDVRRLPHLDIGPKDLPPLERAELQRRYSRAVGAPLLLVMTAISAGFTLLGLWLLTRGAGAQGWFVAGFFGLCTLSSFRQWRRAR